MDGDALLVVEVHGAHTATHQGHVDALAVEGVQRIVAAHQLDLCPAVPLETGDGALGPRIGQQPAETELEGQLMTGRGQGRVERRQGPLHVNEEVDAGVGELDATRGALQQSHRQARLQLGHGAAQGRLCDQQLLRGLGERAAPSHRGERPQVPQLDTGCAVGLGAVTVASLYAWGT